MADFDFLKSNFLNNFHAVPLLDIVLSLVLAFAMGFFIRCVYQRTFKGAVYSSAFAVSLMAMTAITTTLMMAVASNMLLSLGMVGALSIVRFRTAIKTPMEIVFLFWAIEAGIVISTGIFLLGLIGNVAIGLFLLFVEWGGDSPTYMLIVRCKDSEQYRQAMTIAERYGRVEEKSVTPRLLRKDTLPTETDSQTEETSATETDSQTEETSATETASQTEEASATGVVFVSQDIEGNWEICFRKKRKDHDAGGSKAILLLDELSKQGVEASVVSYNRSYMI